MGIEGYGVVPAGTRDRSRHKGGHFHVLINMEQLPDTETGWIIPDDDNIIHLNGGETGVLLDLPVGEHTLQVLLGDEKHESFDPPMISEKITIIVR